MIRNDAQITGRAVHGRGTPPTIWRPIYGSNKKQKAQGDTFG